MEPKPQEAHNEKPVQVAEALPAHQAVHGDYSSNPIDTTKEAWKAFWQNGKQSFVAVVAIDTLLAFVGGITLAIGLIAAVFALVFTAINGGNTTLVESYTGLISYMPADVAEILNGLMHATTGLWIIALASLAIGLFACSFLAANLITYANMSVVQRQVVHIGEIMSAAFKRTAPLMGYALLIFAAVIVATVIVSILLSGIPSDSFMFIAFPLVIVLAIFSAIIAIRLTFASYMVVAEKLGPVQAIKQSWQLTRKRSWEIIGIISLIGVASLVIELVFIGLSAATNNSTGLSLSVSVVELLVNIATSLVAVAVIAQFYSQVKNAAASGVAHKVNYGLNIGMFGLLIIAALIGSGIQNALAPEPTPLESLNLQDSSLYDDSPLPPEDTNLEDIYNDLYNRSGDPNDTPPLYQ